MTTITFDTQEKLDSLKRIQEMGAAIAQSLRNNFTIQLAQISSTFQKTAEAFRSTTTSAQMSFNASVQSMQGYTEGFSKQLSELSSIGKTLSLVEPLEKIKQALVDLNETLKDSRTTLEKFWDSFSSGVGFVSSFTTVILNLKRIHNEFKIVQKLLNKELYISIGLWIKNTAQVIGAQVATIALTVAKGVKKAITIALTAVKAALNLVMMLNPIMLVVAAVGALIAVFVVLWNRFEGFRDFIKGLFRTITSGVVEFINRVISVINSFLNAVLAPINALIRGLNVIPGVNISQVSVAIPGIPTFADGGFPQQGQLFWAREAGPELVGTIGGRTAVANNDQIVEAVARGVYQANADQKALLRDVRELLMVIANKDSSVYLDGRELYKNHLKQKAEWGVQLGTGPAFS